MSEVRIDGLGSAGDGIATLDGKTVHVPFTAPGDVVEIEIPRPARKPKGRGKGRPDAGAAPRPRVVKQVSAGPDRVEPACPHFGRCGGCALQHLSADFLADWKREQVVAALERRGISDVAVGETFRGGPGRRRRVSLTAQVGGRRSVAIGFHERGSRNLVDIGPCPVLEPALEALIAPLRSLLAAHLAPQEAARISINMTDSGADMLLEAEMRQGPDLFMDLAEFAETHDLARLTLTGREGETPIGARRQPVLEWPGLTVSPPPGAFLQTDRMVEAEMRRRVRAAAEGAASVADLFCGVGTLTAGIPPVAEVLAIDSAADAVRSLRAGADKARRTNITTSVRNLTRDPLSAVEISPLDLVILDPPAAGARAQVEVLAGAGAQVPCIAYASCAPGTFARDARILIDGGYRLVSLTPFDQFHWSPEIELFGLFELA
ncbi:MAG: hypothetical protein P1U37_06885 [Minwuia sp.]|nr:hypothetical protein [Minwuia sp.]